MSVDRIKLLAISCLFFLFSGLKQLTAQDEPDVTGFTLINAGTDKPLEAFDPLPDKTRIDLRKLKAHSLSLRANTKPETVGSVRFDVDGTKGVRTESQAPYALGGDRNGDYAAWDLAPGKHSVSATPFSKPGAKGNAGKSRKITFTVLASEPGNEIIVEAGPDILVRAPQDSAVLNGSCKNKDNKKLKYTWRLISGKEVSLHNKHTAALRITGLEEGVYTLKLEAACKEEALGADTANVYVTGEDARGAKISGELKKWHRISLTAEGPVTGEKAVPNPFLNYSFDVVFTHKSKAYFVPGFFKADGKAADTGAEKGRKWGAYFTPDATGKWQYAAFLRSGKHVAVKAETQAKCLATFAGSFDVEPSDKEGRDHRAKGLLCYTGKRYLQFQETGSYFLKGGADSPENFLAYEEFDGTYDIEGLKRKGEARGGEFLHSYGPHVRDWCNGDPTWKNGKGKGIIGALNYLASKGMNSVYFLTMNVGGDGKDVWPWISHKHRLRFDVSKLDQWEAVFSHMDKCGIMLHVITQETENDQLLDGGRLGLERKLYYRELVARFSHHLALVWNLGEENTNSTSQRKSFARYIRELDPYGHPVVVHTFPGKYEQVYTPLLGFPAFEGPSLQTNDTHNQTRKWIDKSEKAGRQWFVCLDEVGPANTGVKPDEDDFQHKKIRSKHLWGNLMAGGAGVEWYFGYKYRHNDLNCEDWRSRDHMWDLTRYALDFFQNHLPFQEMEHHDELVEGNGAYCFAQTGRIYALYLPRGGSVKLDLKQKEGPFNIRWYNPRKGGALKQGPKRKTGGPGKVTIGPPPSGVNKDWVALLCVPGYTKKSTEKAEKNVISLFDGKTLKGWKITKFGGQGDVYVKDGKIYLEQGTYLTGITWTKPVVRMNYEISLDAMRVEGTDFFCGLTFPFGDSPCSLILGGWGGSVCGLSSIDFYDAANNETTKFISFKNKKWYHARLRVTPNRIQAWLDGKEIVDVNTKGRHIGIRPEVELSRPLGIATFDTTGAIRNIELKKLKPNK